MIRIFITFIACVLATTAAQAQCIVADPTPTPLNARTAPNGTQIAAAQLDGSFGLSSSAKGRFDESAFDANDDRFLAVKAGPKLVDRGRQKTPFGSRCPSQILTGNATQRLRDIQALAGHSNLSTTQRHIESHAEAQRKIVELV